MRPFDELTDAGRTRRLSQAVRLHLGDHHQITARRVRPLPRTFNRMFAVDTTDGRRLAVRVGSRHRIHAPDVEAIEHHWLERLAADTTIDGPRLLADTSGRPSGHLEHPGLDRPRLATVFTWLPGRRARRPLGATTAHAAGQLLARLHQHATTLTVPATWAEAVRADQPITFLPRQALTRWSGPGADLIAEAVARCQHVVDRLWSEPPHEPHLLHGDFGPHNLLTDGAGLRPVDFQDLLWGFSVQDVSISLADMRRWSTPAPAVSRFVDGYRSIRPWPAEDPAMVAALDAGRTLNLINLGLVVDRPDRREHIDRHLADLRRWLRA